MDPASLREWLPVFRDFTIVLLATFLLIFETVFAAVPNAYVIGAGLTLLGAPAAIRADTLRRNARRDDENGDPLDGPGGYYREPRG